MAPAETAGKSGSGAKEGNLVAAEGGAPRDEGEPRFECLGDEQPVERVPVIRGKGQEPLGVPEGDRQFGEA